MHSALLPSSLLVTFQSLVLGKISLALARIST